MTINNLYMVQIKVVSRKAAKEIQKAQRDDSPLRLLYFLCSFA
jgi:hypothetical protein